MLYFDMGSICAHVKRVSFTTLECEIQNEGWIYENQTIVFGSKFKRDKTRFGMSEVGSGSRKSFQSRSQFEEDAGEL